MAEYKIDDILKVSSENDNELYDGFRDINLVVVDVFTSSDEHPLYDDSMEGQGLYQLVGNNEEGTYIPHLLYEYELDYVGRLESFTLKCNKCDKEVSITDDYKNGSPVHIYDGKYHVTENINIDCECGSMVVFDK